MERRNFIKTITPAALALTNSYGATIVINNLQIKNNKTMKIDLTLPELPYSKNALVPFITEETFDYHYGKHHQTYVTNLNNLVKDTADAELSVEQIVINSAKLNNIPMFNNAAQHYNHSFFWHCMTPDGGSTPKGKIGELITRDFGSFENFKAKFSETAVKLFGAGWAWLAQNEKGLLEIIPMKDAHTPLTENKTPILTLDVWEHAYYIDYRNARPKFVEGFWDVVNWEFANNNLKI
jgi:Fe-Mn family superoxide dismutase